MKSERRKLGKALIFVVLFATLAFVSVGCASAATHYVNPGESIQAAVNAASDGDTIIVNPGVYIENVDIPKSLTIKSASGFPPDTMVYAENTNDHIFEVTADCVNISGFTLTGTTWYAGVYLESTNHCNISNNVISNNCRGIFLSFSSNNILTGNIASNNDIQGIGLRYSVNNVLTGNTVSNNGYGIYLCYYSSNNTFTNNTASNNEYEGISLSQSSNSVLTGNIANSNNGHGIYLWDSSNSVLTNNTASNNDHFGIYLSELNNNVLTGNTASNSYYGIFLAFSSNNVLTNNTALNNDWYGIYLSYSINNVLTGNSAFNNSEYGIFLDSSSSNKIYNNYFNNTNNAYDNGYNIWNITKTAGTNIIGGPYMGGNYWSDYAGEDLDGDGLGDTFLPYNSSGNIQNGGDWLPLVKSAPLLAVFDTGEGTYPSIMGTHEGTITPNKTIVVHKMYTYSCAGTGGHTEYVRFYGNDLDVNKTWSGYIGDYHNISFDPPITLKANITYNYEIRTGSYPQIIHEQSFPVPNGTINCTQFTDANGKIYYDWIPAIRLE